MRNIFRIGLFLFCAFFSAPHIFAAEYMPAFDARVSVLENGTIEVSERIEYDFGNDERHGIFRKIPYSYQAGTETYTAEVRSVLVTDEQGEPRPFSESRGNGELTLKIGDPDKVVTGTHVYVISYIVEGPFLYFDEFDELYWNVTGYWDLPIQQASVLVDLPKGVQVLSASCYQGVDGSKSACMHDEKLVNVEQAGYNARAENLAKNEGLTVAIAFPKGVIVEKKNPWETGDKATQTPLEYIPFAIPLVTLIFMFWLWYTRGRDPKGKGAIVTQFSPPEGISPSLAGVILKEKVKDKSLSAEIVQLAVSGFIKIHRYEKKVLLFSNTDYVLERIGEEVPKDALGVLVLEKLFQKEFEGEVEIDGVPVAGVLLSKMQHKFVQEKKDIHDYIYTQVAEQGFFVTRPDKSRNLYCAVGIGLFAFGLAFTVALSEEGGTSAFVGVSLVITGIILFLFGNWMPVKTKEGVRIREYLEGFKRYLEVAEKDRINFHSSPEQDKADPEKTIKLFDTYLPYAMIFGVEEKWAEKFADIYTEEPKWYSGGAGHAFVAGNFASDLSSFASQVSSASAPQSSGSGGGGHSGGGFGGGGGGSW